MGMNPVPLGDAKMVNDGEETIQSHSTDDSKGNSTVTGSNCVKGTPPRRSPAALNVLAQVVLQTGGVGDPMTTGASLSASLQACVIA